MKNLLEILETGKVGELVLMNPHSGTVQTAAEWESEGYTTENAELLAVVWVGDEWIEV